MSAHGSILVVDDELLNRRLLSTNLANAGYDVALAADGAVALEMLAAQPFDVVLLDLMMPEVDGFEVLAWMKENPMLRHIPVIVISGMDDIENIVACIEAGATDYLNKPFDPVLLHARINASLAVKRLRDQEIAHTQQLEMQLEMAARAQRSMLPTRLPAVPGFEFGAHFEPAREVGGDFYDVARLKNGQIAVLIADVSDKGMHAALFMAVTRALFLQEAGSGARPADVALSVHRGLLEVSNYNMFVTAIYGVLDPATGVFQYVRAGHEFPLLTRAGGQAEYLGGPGSALGVSLGPPKLEEQQLVLEPGDCLVLYSDGVTDMRNADRQPFGAERLWEVVTACQSASADTIAQTIYAEVQAHRGAALAFDDFSLVVLRAL